VHRVGRGDRLSLAAAARVLRDGVAATFPVLVLRDVQMRPEVESKGEVRTGWELEGLVACTAAMGEGRAGAGETAEKEECAWPLC